MGGLTVATALGVPLGTWIGRTDWRLDVAGDRARSGRLRRAGPAPARTPAAGRRVEPARTLRPARRPPGAGRGRHHLPGLPVLPDDVHLLHGGHPARDPRLPGPADPAAPGVRLRGGRGLVAGRAADRPVGTPGGDPFREHGLRGTGRRRSVDAAHHADRASSPPRSPRCSAGPSWSARSPASPRSTPPTHPC
ncbi:hypothetical protein ACRAWF_08520 [Streptomyces sp. L7]